MPPGPRYLACIIHRLPVHGYTRKPAHSFFSAAEDIATSPGVYVCLRGEQATLSTGVEACRSDYPFLHLHIAKGAKPHVEDTAMDCAAAMGVGTVHDSYVVLPCEYKSRFPDPTLSVKSRESATTHLPKQHCSQTKSHQHRATCELIGFFPSFTLLVFLSESHLSPERSI